MALLLLIAAADRTHCAVVIVVVVNGGGQDSAGAGDGLHRFLCFYKNERKRERERLNVMKWIINHQGGRQVSSSVQSHDSCKQNTSQSVRVSQSTADGLTDGCNVAY